MPVQFKGHSEYDRHFKWVESFKSKSFKPTEQQSAPVAGQHSSKINPDVNEPMLQRKKRVGSAPLQVHKGESVNEPQLQSKKRVEAPMAQTSPSKFRDISPEWQRKKRPGQGPPMKLGREVTLLQSKRRVAGPTSTEIEGDELCIQKKKRVVPPFTEKFDKGELTLQSKKKAGTTEPEKSSKDEVNLQTKKKIDPPGNEKPIQCEPPLQSKRRAPGPAATLAPDFYERYYRDEYALLGNQDKFAQNIKYKIKNTSASRDVSPPKQPKIQKVSKSKENVSPKAAPVVNTDQFKTPSTPLAPRKPKDQSDPMIARVKAQVEKEMKSSSVQRSPKAEKPRAKSADPRDRKPLANSNLDSGEVVKQSLKDKKIDNMNAFTQVDMEKGVVDSAPEAPADYALKYKTGIAPPRPTKKVSEYQKQFGWKAGSRASPLLKAEQDLGPDQVVYNNNPQLSPPKKDPIPKMSEYQRQFKTFKMTAPPPAEEQIIPEKSSPKAKLKRSKSMEDLSPAEIKPAGSAPVIAPDNPRLTIESEPDSKPVKAVPVVPRGKPRNYKSEYLSNFKSPTQFKYSQGAWKGAHPAHLAMSMPEPVKDSPKPLSNWFAEVLELRRKANEYRLRAQGTHFSRQHLVQLMAKQADMWDASTITATARSSSGGVSARSLEWAQESIQSDTGRKNQKEFNKGQELVSTAATIASEDEPSTARLSDTEEPVPGQKKLAWTEQEESPDTPSTYGEYGEDMGRLTTPTLRRQIEQTGNMRRRHHLDLTTPSVGGAILSSPPRVEKRGKAPRPAVESPPPAQDDDGDISNDTLTEAPVYKPLAGQKTYTADRGSLATTPTFGLPSRDSHLLRDDDASTLDRPLTTQYVHSPVHKRGSVRRQGDLGIIDEGYGQTYNKSKADVLGKKMAYTIDGGIILPRVDPDEDVLSVSARSVASSCSLASEVLERAQKRKDEFWGKGGIATR